MKIGDTVEVTGRPYGDCPELDYQIDTCSPIGTRLTVVKLHTDPDGAELSDGFQYPATSFKLAYTPLGITEDNLCIGASDAT